MSLNRDGIEWVEDYMLKAFSKHAGPAHFYRFRFIVGDAPVRPLIREAQEILARLNRAIADVNFILPADGRWRLEIVSTVSLPKGWLTWKNPETEKYWLDVPIGEPG